jgi:hypothetical protein
VILFHRRKLAYVGYDKTKKNPVLKGRDLPLSICIYRDGIERRDTTIQNTIIHTTSNTNQTTGIHEIS